MNFEYTDEHAPEVRETRLLVLGCGAVNCAADDFPASAKYVFTGRRIYVEFDNQGIVTKREYVRYQRSQDATTGWRYEERITALGISEADCAQLVAGVTAETYFARGQSLLGRNEYSAARSCFLRAHEIVPRGRYAREAASQLGMMYEIGLGVEKDSAAAKSWYEKAGY